MNVYLGFDIGSTFTKICVLDENGEIVLLDVFATPVMQREAFSNQIKSFAVDYQILASASCGYGRQNIDVETVIPELVALSKGMFYVLPEVHTVLDIGGQDTKVICCHDGKLTRFLLNDKCAAGSGLFVQNALRILDLNFDSLVAGRCPEKPLSTVCAVFAQTEIIRLIAEGRSPEQLINSVFSAILKQAAVLLHQIKPEPLLAFTGGLSLISGMGDLLSTIVQMDVTVPTYSSHLAAIGCAVTAREKKK